MDKWFLKLNINKCKAFSYVHHIDSMKDYYFHSEGFGSVLEHNNYIKHLILI